VGRRVPTDFYTVAHAAQKEFELDALWFLVFQIGGQAQSAVSDLTWDTLTLRAFNPSYIVNLAAAVATGSTDAVRVLANAETRSIAWEQLKNNLGVVGLVNQASETLKAPATGEFPLESLIAKAYALGNYPALWAVEGLGEDYANTFINSGKPFSGILTTGKAAALPDASLLMMHAGMGLAFANHVLGDVTPYSCSAQLDQTLACFLELVRANSREGYAGPALESLGLTTRTWYPEMVRPVSTRLALIDPATAEYFWHGVGRSLYFLPLNMIPGFSPWRAAEQEPPDETARRNATAGVAWAFTVVNIRQPEIIASFLKHNGSQASRNDAFSDGVLSTLIMRSEMVPGDEYVAAFVRFKPVGSDGSLAEIWTGQTQFHGESPVDNCRKALKAAGRLGEIFRYHPLSEVAGSLCKMV
jgi:hypothetical protein